MRSSLQLDGHEEGKNAGRDKGWGGLEELMAAHLGESSLDTLVRLSEAPRAQGE